MIIKKGKQMIVIKIIILLGIFILSIYIGMLISDKYTDRVDELKDIKSALNIFETKIRYTYETIPEAFAEISKQFDGKKVGKLFKTAVEELKENTAGQAWKCAIEKTNLNINMEDKNAVEDLSKTLGNTDLQGQISQIELTQNFLSTQIEKAEAEKSKNAKMYKTLGGIVGLMIVIIFA